jgi:hypothetical protein
MTLANGLGWRLKVEHVRLGDGKHAFRLSQRERFIA